MILVFLSKLRRKLIYNLIKLKGPTRPEGA
jgi:hypothetical protein